MQQSEFRKLFLDTIDNRENPFHPLVWINGDPEIGEGTYIGGFSEVNAKWAQVVIGENCDIASFVAINVADSHRKCIGLDQENTNKNIKIGDNVFIGSHCAVLGGASIGHNSVIAAGTIVRHSDIPPFSLVVGSKVMPGYYKAEYETENS